jgi:hypothetical protein
MVMDGLLQNIFGFQPRWILKCGVYVHEGGWLFYRSAKSFCDIVNKADLIYWKVYKNER